MKRILTYIGAFLAISGITSTILYLIDYDLSILNWINSWGTTIGWVIRIGFIVAGILLFFLFGQSTEEPAAPED